MNPPERQDIHKLTWNAQNDCIFEMTITNNAITDIHFCGPPDKVHEAERVCFKATDEHYLRQFYACLGEGLAYLDKERNKTGVYKLDEVAASKVKLDEITEAP